MESFSRRAILLASFDSNSACERARSLHGRSIVIFGPGSSLGQMHLPALIEAGANIVMVVDDFCKNPYIYGIPVKSSQSFFKAFSAVKDAVIVDFSIQPYAQALCRKLGSITGLVVRDMLELLAAYDSAAVYEPVTRMRQLTLSRIDDWLKLADRLADDLSRETLYAVLLQRLEYDRCYVAGVNIWGRDEYFGVGAQSETFVLGGREHFVDCGAHTGTVVKKMLAATRWSYSSIHAFEPDFQNYAELTSVMPIPQDNCHLHQSAVSNKSEILCFSQTGTMGSHVAINGNVEVSAVTLDDSVDCATFIKMDVEGYEARALLGATRLLTTHHPRLAIAAYHYAHDFLNIVQTLDDISTGYQIHLRQHFNYYYDSIIYATPRKDWMPSSGVI